ncbi:hypothetical protein [Arthrobacter sp. SLBN-112]|uniref:hypothetical protein n=1 Tax=Arthrobacter sp. SLBN-112 TaxID=2768452 RepID=UPI0027B389FC|nr:hypothetical protein [Arthrobacter sp. SLBN-112]MDQ0802107.1 hypothetical protein [Arthrobacter sp. SLBN-112]
MSVTAVPRQDTNTLVVGAGQAGLATSYWLAQRGGEHRIVKQRPALGGAWQDRWDSFYLNTPNFSVGISPDVPQLDSHDYRNPGQLPDGAVLLVGIDAPEAEAAGPDSWQPAGSGSRLDLREEGITSIIWSTGYALDFSMLDLPLLDEWNYPATPKA